MTRLRLPFIVLIGCTLLLPMSFAGFYVDDYLHQWTLDGDQVGGPMKPYALFDFGALDDWRTMDVEVGAFPWWTDADWRVRFFRPFASTFLWGQHAVFGGWATGYHLTSLGLFAFLLVAAHRMYRTLGLSEGAARCATLLLACSDSSVLPVGWPANQSTLLVAVLGTLALIFLFEGRGRPVLALACACLALLAKESGSAAVFLVFCGCVARYRSDRDRRGYVAGALAAIVVLLAWFIHLLAAGYGTASLFYATPWSDPGRFFANLAFLASAGIVSMTGPFSLDVTTMFPEMRVTLLFLCLPLAILLLVWMRKALHDVSAWLLAWVVLFLGVQAGAPPSDRLLFVPMVGAAAIFALFFERQAREHGERSRLGRIATKALFVVMTFGAGTAALGQAAGLALGANFLRESVRQIDVGDPSIGRRDLYVLQTESQLQAFSLHATYGYERNDHELMFWVLQASNRPLVWTRTGDRKFELRSDGLPFLEAVMERIYLSAPPAAEPGRTWAMNDFDVRALDVQNGAPTRLEFTLRKSLDDASVGFLRSVDGVLTRIDVPAVGESVELPAPDRAGPFMP